MTRLDSPAVLPLLLLVLIGGAPAGAMMCRDQVVINEIMFDPADVLGDDEDYEWVELHNTTGHAVSLAGWRLNHAPLDGEIPPHDYVLVARQDRSDPDGDGEFFSAFYHPDNGYQISARIIDLAGQTMGLDGDDFELRLFDDQDQVVDWAAFHPAPGGDGDGSTLERLVALHGGSEAEFLPSEPPGRHGTPEGQNSTSPLTVHVSLPDAPVAPGDTLHIEEIITNRDRMGHRVRIWREILTPSQRRIPFEHPDLPTEVHVPGCHSLRLEADVVVPAPSPLGEFGYHGIIGDGSESLGSDWDEFIVESSDHIGPPPEEFHAIVKF